MSDSAPLGNLPIYIARTWTTGESMTRTKFQSEFDQAEALLTLCKTALADIQNRRHGTSSPTENAIAGQIWAKKISAARTQWFGDPDGAGADDQFLTENEAYNADAKTAGTGTFKVGGAIDYVASASGALTYQFTMPSNTLSDDGNYVKFFGFRIGPGIDGALTAVLGNFTPANLSPPAGDCIFNALMVRSGGSSYKAVVFINPVKDSVVSGSESLLRTGSGTSSLSANVVCSFTFSQGVSGGTGFAELRNG